MTAITKRDPKPIIEVMYQCQKCRHIFIEEWSRRNAYCPACGSAETVEVNKP